VAAGELMIVVAAWIAEQEPIRISERVRASAGPGRSSTEKRWRGFGVATGQPLQQFAENISA
jgi:hypothetical protein